MSLEKSEAFVLKVVRFRARDQVVTVFSREKGLFSVFAPGSKKRSLLEPLMHVELICAPGKGELMKLHDITILSTKPLLRLNFKKLRSASAMLNALSLSQLPYKASPLLYQSLDRHLYWLEDGKNTEALLGSFLVKLLKHDSLLRIGSTCAQCTAPPIYIEQGEGVCEQHRQKSSFSFNSEEIYHLQFLFNFRNYHELADFRASLEFLEKVSLLFNQITIPAIKSG